MKEHWRITLDGSAEIKKCHLKFDHHIDNEHDCFDQWEDAKQALIGWLEFMVEDTKNMTQDEGG